MHGSIRIESRLRLQDRTETLVPSRSVVISPPEHKMTTYQAKEQIYLDTPLFLFDCTFADGAAFHWSTHHASVQGTDYVARIVKTNVFQMQVASDGGVDTIPRISLELANADGLMSELERRSGFKGAAICVRFVFYSL